MIVKLVYLFKRYVFGIQPPLPLPIGRTEYEAWAKRIIAGAAVPGLTDESANFALTSMLLHLPSTQSMHTDAFFCHALRKAAVNQTAHAILTEIHEKSQAKKAAAAGAPLKVVPNPEEKGSGTESAPNTTSKP